MTENVREYLEILKKRDYRKDRIDNLDVNMDPVIAGMKKSGMDTREFPAIFLKQFAEREKLFLYGKSDAFGFHRYQKNYLTCTRPSDGKQHRLPLAANLTPNYALMIGRGFDKTREIVKKNREAGEDADQKYFNDSILSQMDTMQEFVGKNRDFAAERGNVRLAEALKNIPAKPASTFYEACLFLYLLTYFLRGIGGCHMTLGRFDQYMLPYYLHDKAAGVSDAELLETLELFFIALNFDSDLYPGVQQGDNGQSMVLGGYDKDGNEMFNGLSRLCMDASLELNLIDPKINLRVSKKTEPWLFELGTKLTKKGLGFPQYCNDDVVVPGLVALGYDYEDALNYTVAACWEYIVPNVGQDIPNVRTFNFPVVINRSIREHLKKSKNFELLMFYVRNDIEKECIRLAEGTVIDHFSYSPLVSLMTDNCVELGRDISEHAAKYYNYGCHGAGIANAADALAAVKKLVYDEKSLDPDELFAALDANFEGYAALRNRLLACPKMGNNDDEVDEIANRLMDAFSTYLNNRPNGLWGIWRAGTGSAMEYILSARECPATADGKLAGDPYPSSFSPALTTKLSGPLSTVRSFTKYDMKRIINGGPVTMEVHDTVFRNEEGEKKVAQLVRAFVDLGGHQLQINSINRETLLDAQKHPENYPNLIVRVWGWSGYFCELDPDYQNHIIRRTEFTV